ncbi:ribonuclease H-like domain-containing protein [Trametes elegans]|nr:ribonuclease H-like domain-containing protein [Trametes elegans]
MTPNAFKEASLSATFYCMTPPSSPTRKAVRSASQVAPAFSSKPPPPLRPSRLLAALESAIPHWLNGTSSSPTEVPKISPPLASPPLIDPKPLHPFLMSSQHGSQATKPKLREPSKTAPASASATSKGKAKAKSATSQASDIENRPVPEMNVDGEEAPEAGALLPVYSYKDYSPTPAVVYTPDEGEANDLAQCLKGPVLGFDLEWVVTFRRNKGSTERKTALVQLCDARMILLVQVSAMKKFPQKIKEIIENKSIVKVGANIKNDGQKLFRDFGILARSLVELGTLAHVADPSFANAYRRKIVSLARVVEMYTQKTLPKGKVRTSNWETRPLSEEQQYYAANDAHCALMVYNRLLAIATERGSAFKPELLGADLEAEYQSRTTHPPLTAHASGSSSTASSSAQSTPYFDTYFSRPLVFAGEAPPLHPTSSYGLNSSTGSAPGAAHRELPRPQHLRAYNLWHHRDLPLREICATLRSKENPLAESTVISYVVRALQADPTLPYSMVRLKALVQEEAGSWQRHKGWILQVDGHA